jgi:type IV pilus assembly protein PilN
MIRVNLLPVRVSRRLEAVRRELFIAGIGALLLVFAGAAVFLWQTATANGLHAENARLQKDLETLKIAVARVDEVEKMNAELRRKLDVIAELQADKVGPVHLLDELAAALPEKVSLTSLKQDADKITLLGDAASNEVISQFLINLERSPWFEEVYLVSIDQTTVGAYNLKTFQVSSRLVIPKEEQERQKTAARAAVDDLDGDRASTPELTGEAPEPPVPAPQAPLADAPPPSTPVPPRAGATE